MTRVARVGRRKSASSHSDRVPASHTSLQSKGCSYENDSQIAALSRISSLFNSHHFRSGSLNVSEICARHQSSRAFKTGWAGLATSKSNPPEPGRDSGVDVLAAGYFLLFRPDGIGLADLIQFLQRKALSDGCDLRSGGY